MAFQHRGLKIIFISNASPLLMCRPSFLSVRCLRRSFRNICRASFVNNQREDLSKFFFNRLWLCRNCTWSPLYLATRGLKSFSDEPDDKKSVPQFLPVEFNSIDDNGIGQEIAGPLTKREILKVIEKFYIDPAIKELAEEQGLDRHIYQQTVASFRKFCSESNNLPTELHIVISDILKSASHIHDLYPYFFKHARTIFPHLDCIKELEKVSDLSHPPNWYPEARKINRRIIYHAGPTNSGKTYHALEQYLSADSGVYCGPLKLLASEIYYKSNARGTPCDLVTGEEKKYCISHENPSSHVSCTVEMTSVVNNYEVAIIDEIQMISDLQRGWAWTRAFLGVCANEVHVCGEGSAIEIIKELAMSMGEDVEVRRYKRLTKLHIMQKPLLKYDNVESGDCIVTFSKQNLIKIAQNIEKDGHEVAVLYGGLPPASKLAQAQKFNDPEHPCKVLVATDAIGMGLNLSIRRIIFHSLIKPRTNEKGEKEMDTINISQALQIAGRAGRYGTQYEEGFVTTLKTQDLSILGNLLNSLPPDIEQCGIHPTAEQIELFAYHLPDYTLSNLMDIFVNICSVDSSRYFLCFLDDFKYLANLIQHISLPLRTRYVFCCAPINMKKPFVAALFLKFSRHYAQNEVVSLEWLCRHIKWPLSSPKTVDELMHLEDVFDVFDLYLWLSYRLANMFPDADLVRGLQTTLDNLIFEGVSHITKLTKGSTQGISDREEGIGNPLDTSSMKDEAFATSLLKKTSNHPRLNNKFSEGLLRKGIISKHVLRKLKKEWMEELEN